MENRRLEICWRVLILIGDRVRSSVNIVDGCDMNIGCAECVCLICDAGATASLEQCHGVKQERSGAAARMKDERIMADLAGSGDGSQHPKRKVEIFVVEE